MPIQDWVHAIEEGAGARVIRFLAAVLGFAALAVIYDVTNYRGFSNQEAMESAHLARQISEGRGFTTDSIQPLAVYLLQTVKGTNAPASFAVPAPDVTTPPGYPLLLSGLMSVLPFHFKATQNFYYQPEFWIAIFNQVLLFFAAAMVFLLGRRLFDPTVGWLAAAVFAGSELFWRFSVSGLSTIWLTLLFLGLVWCLTGMEARERTAPPGEGLLRSVGLAALAGILVAVGGLSRYSFALLIFPVLAFMLLFLRRGQGWLCLTLAISFVVVLGPWLARNYVICGNCFGTQAYGLFEQIRPWFTEDSIERSLNPGGLLRHVTPGDVMDKFMINAREMFENDLPRLGGSWVSAFFLAGLLVPFRNPSLRRVRWFALGAVVFLFVAQALGQTHLTVESPVVNGDNLLAITAPLVFILGAGFFYTLLDQFASRQLPEARAAATGAFVLVMAAGYLFALVNPKILPDSTPYMPALVQRVGGLIGQDEWMMSDVPWAVAWYGNRPCAWLTQDDGPTFYRLNKIKPVKMVYLTQRTTERRFLSQMAAEPNSWGEFILNCWVHREAPDGFPLAYAPSGYLPYQMLLADRPRWQPSSR